MPRTGGLVVWLENFTVASNFLELLFDVEAVGVDLKFSPMAGAGAPSVRVKVLAVGGS
jgi:PmbA protein